MKSIKFLFAGATVALSCAALADPSSEQIGNYTWYYQIVDGKSAEICPAGDAMGAVNPKPSGPVTLPAKLGGKPVTSIADYAFSLYDKITSVTIPDTVTDIGAYAFTQNGKLQCVQFGKKVNKIGSLAFNECKELKSIVFKGNAPTDVHDSAFDDVRNDCCVYRAKTAKGWEKAQDTFPWIFGLEYKIGDCMVDVPAESYSIRGGTGTVTGGGVYALGKKISLKAKADAGSVFCGWMSQDVLLGTTAHLGWALSYSDYTVTGESIKFVGRFITAQEDVDYFALETYADATDSDGALDLNLTPYVHTWSEPKLSFKNLPAGLKYDAKAFKITGKATKPGIYKVAVSATNKSVTKAITAEWTITVPNFYDDVVPLPTDYYGDFIPGVGYADMIAEAEGCTVTGLPTGMKWTAKNLTDKTLGDVQADSYYGVPTKPGDYTVYFTKTVKEGTKSVKHTSTATFHVGPFPKLTIKMEGNSGKDKVTGDGEYAANKKVTLKATPDTSKDNPKVFRGWYDEDDNPLSQAATYSHVMGSKDETITAKFITQKEDADNIKVAVSDVPAFNANLEAVVEGLPCGVSVNWPIAVDALSQTTVKVSGLPTGLKFTAKEVVDAKTGDVIATANSIYGAPTAESKTKIVDGMPKKIPSDVKIEVTTAGKTKKAYVIHVFVDPMEPWVVGTFNGGIGDADDAFGLGSVTVASTGKISGKRSLDADTWTVSAAYFESYDKYNEVYTAMVELKKGTFFDYIPMTFTRKIGNLAEVKFNDMKPAYLLYSVPWKTEPWKTLAKKFTTAAAKTLEITGITDYASTPGTLTLQFDASGSVKAKGVFGKSNATCSTVVTPITDISDPSEEFDAYVYVVLPAKGTFNGYGALLTLHWNGTAFSVK